MEKNWRFEKLDLLVTHKNLMNKRDTAKSGHTPLAFNKAFYSDDAAFI